LRIDSNGGYGTVAGEWRSLERRAALTGTANHNVNEHQNIRGSLTDWQIDVNAVGIQL
jgi:hypothetical protein